MSRKGKGKKKGKTRMESPLSPMIDVEGLATLLAVASLAAVAGSDEGAEAAVASARLYTDDLRECGCAECQEKAAAWAAKGRTYLADPTSFMRSWSDLQRAAVVAALDQLESAVAHAAGAD